VHFSFIPSCKIGTSTWRHWLLFCMMLCRCEPAAALLTLIISHVSNTVQHVLSSCLCLVGDWRFFGCLAVCCVSLFFFHSGQSHCFCLSVCLFVFVLILSGSRLFNYYISVSCCLCLFISFINLLSIYLSVFSCFCIPFYSFVFVDPSVCLSVCCK